MAANSTWAWNPTPDRSRKHSKTEQKRNERILLRGRKEIQGEMVSNEKEGKEGESDYIVCHEQTVVNRLVSLGLHPPNVQKKCVKIKEKELEAASTRALPGALKNPGGEKATVETLLLPYPLTNGRVQRSRLVLNQGARDRVRVRNWTSGRDTGNLVRDVASQGSHQ
jgi:hypothetical protein